MVKYFHIDPHSQRAVEITEGEYWFRLRKHTTWGTDREAEQFLRPGFGFESRHGTCYVTEVSDGVGKTKEVTVRRA